MNNEWKITKIGFLGKVITGKTPSTQESDNFGDDYPFITIPDLDGRVFIEKTERSLSKKGASKVKGSLLPANAVMMSCIATVGKCGITTKPSFTNQQINSVICDKDTDPRFLYYVFTQLGNELDSFGGGGSVYANISKSRFSDIEIKIPPLPEQRAIAEVLSALDDKIELNRRMNQTLESLAQAIFKHMFIDNPERERWGSKPLSTIADFIKGVSYSSAELVEVSDTALVTLKSFNRGGGYKEEGLKPYAGFFKTQQKISPGEVVVAHTDLTQMAEVIGRPARVEENEKYINLVASLDLVIVRPKIEEISNEFIYCLLAYGDFPDFAYGYTNGTTVLHLSTKALSDYTFPLPPKSYIKEFSDIVTPLYAQLDLNNKQSRNLAELRDTLLPRLMSGQVRVV